MSSRVFDNLKDQGLNLPCDTSLVSANSSSLDITGCRLFTVVYRDIEYNVPVYIVNNLNENAIAGIDMIKNLGICYDPRSSSFISEISLERIELRTTRAIHFDPFEAVTVRCALSNWAHVDRLATITCDVPEQPTIFFSPSVNSVIEDDKVLVVVKNCGPTSVALPRGTNIGFAEPAASVHTIDELELFKSTSAPPPPLKQDAREKFLNDLHLNVPPFYHNKFVSLFLRNHDVFSKTPNDIGKATHFEHSVMLKNFDPIFRKQFRIPDAHREALEEQVKNWLAMGIIEPCHSRYNAPIFVVPKKGGRIRFVLDYRALNDASQDDRYCMKDVNECIGDIGRAKSSIFSTMDLTHGFWQLPLQHKSRPYTAFTVPGMGQYQYKVLSMGLKGGPGSFQRMMELTTKGLDKTIVYIDDVLVHSQSYEEHHDILEKFFQRLRHFKIKLNLEKCFFGSDSVSYLGFRLTPKGILPGLDKLKAIKDAGPPATLSQVRSFLGLCNFFRGHVPRYAMLCAPLQRLTTKEARYRGPNLPPDALAAFEALKNALLQHPVLQYPRNDLPYELYTDASIGTDDYGGGYGAVLTQPDQFGKNNVIAYASRGLLSYERNYQPFVAEMMAAVWGMNHFGNYLRGRHFTLFTDHKPLEKLSKVHTRTYNRLQEEMMKFSFDLKYKPGKDMPADFLSRSVPASSARHPVQETSMASISVPHLPFVWQTLSVGPTPVHIRDPVSSIDFDTADIREAQSQDPFCKMLRAFLANGSLPDDNAQATLVKRIGPLIFDKSGILFRNNTDPMTDQTIALLVLPKILVPEAVHRAHGALLTGHGGVEKTKRRLLLCYYWPNMQQDIKELLAECPRCQLTVKSSRPHDVLHPLPQCSAPNQRIHMDLFGPLKTPTKAKAYVLCITDAFSKYVEAVIAHDKTAEHVTQLVFDSWICRFGIPSEIVTDGGREFCNKVSVELFKKLNVHHTSTSPAHPQCNAQAEVANKHFQKYLSTMCEGDTLHWEHLVPPMAMAYNTTVHRTTGQTPAFLMFGFQPSLPGLIQPSYDESDNNTRLQILQKARDAAHEHSAKQAVGYAASKDKKAAQADFAPGQQVLLDVRLFPNQNQKLADKFEGPYYIVKIHPKNTCDILKNNKIHRVSFDRIKPYHVQVPINVPDSLDTSDQFNNQMLIPDMPPLIVSQDLVSEEGNDNNVAPPDVDIDVPPPLRKRGRPKKSDQTQVTRPHVEPVPYVGPTTRSRAQVNEVSHSLFTPHSVDTTSYDFGKMLSNTVTDLFKRLLLKEDLRLFIAQMLLDKLKELFPMIFHDVTVRPFRPKVPFVYNKHPSSHSRQVFLSQQDKATQEALLHHDPYFLVDPTIYHYAILRPDNKGSQLGTPHIIKKDSLSSPELVGDLPNLSPALKSEDIWPDTDLKPKLETPTEPDLVKSSSIPPIAIKEQPFVFPLPVPARSASPNFVVPQFVKQDTPLILPDPVPTRPFTPVIRINDMPPMKTPSPPPLPSPDGISAAPLFPFDPNMPDPFSQLPRSNSLDSNATVTYQGESADALGMLPCHLPTPFPPPKPAKPRRNTLYGVEGPEGVNPLFHSPIFRQFKRYASSVSDPVDLIDPDADLSNPSSWQVKVRELMAFENRRRAQKDPFFDFPEVTPPPKVTPAPVVAPTNNDDRVSAPPAIRSAKLVPSPNVMSDHKFAVPAPLPVLQPNLPKVLPAMPPPCYKSQSLPAQPPVETPAFALPLPSDDMSMPSQSSDDLGMPRLSLECPVIVPKMLPAMPPPLCASQSLPAVLPDNIPASALPLPPDDTSMQSLNSDSIDMPSLSLEDPIIVPPPRSLENPLPRDDSMSCAQPDYDNMETNNPYFPGGWRPPPDDTRDSTDSIMDKIRTRP